MSCHGENLNSEQTRHHRNCRDRSRHTGNLSTFSAGWVDSINAPNEVHVCGAVKSPVDKMIFVHKNCSLVNALRNLHRLLGSLLVRAWEDRTCDSMVVSLILGRRTIGRLVLGWVTVFGRAPPYVTRHLGQLSLLPAVGQEMTASCKYVRISCSVLLQTNGLHLMNRGRPVGTEIVWVVIVFVERWQDSWFLVERRG